MKVWKKHPVVGHLLADMLLAAVGLCVFALFHHVLPRAGQSAGIVIVQTEESKTETEDDSEAESTPESTAAPTTSASQKSIERLGTVRHNANGPTGAGTAQKGGSALTEETTVEETQTDDSTVPFSEKFAAQFSSTPICTQDSYRDSNVSVTLSKNTLEDGKITYYLADIYVTDVKYLQTALAGDTYGTGYRDSIADMAAEMGAVLAVNGDYYGNTTEGVVIRNGVLYRANPTDCDVCVLYSNGVMDVMNGASFSVDDAIAGGAWQAWKFGPALLDQSSQPITSFSSTSRLIAANPRTAIGYYEPGHYCLIVVDGRGDSAGITMPQLSRLFYDLGCTAAYNLDGGNSSVMVWNGEVANEPSGGGRESSDCIFIAGGE